MANTILVLAELKQTALKKATLELVSKAAQLAKDKGLTVATLVLSGDKPVNLDQLAEYGCNQCYVVTKAELASYNPEWYTQAFVAACEQIKPDYVLGSFGSVGKDMLPKAATRLKTGVVSDCVGLEWQGNDLVATRPIYAGKAFVNVMAAERFPKIYNIRPNAFPVMQSKAASFAITTMDVAFNTAKPAGKLLDLQQGKSEKPDLTEADIVVSGGRALKSAENFKILEELADLLKAPVGASRAACDAGYRDHSAQVGQTGKVVNPNLYIACGISGAIQHLAGMKTSKCIIAINKDPEAPIFKIANYGIVGDLFTIVPELTKQLKAIL